MELIGRMYRLRNGYSVCKAKLYNGFTTEYFWTVWNSKGELYGGNFQSYEEAYAVAKSF